MPIWLKGAGRTSLELARLLDECNGGKESFLRYRRAHLRHRLDDAYGELIHNDARIPCQFLEISAGGCSLETETAFRHGALAPVEVVLPIFGMILHIGGVTQWVKKQSQMGIRFNHVNCDSLAQVVGLIDCILGRRTVDSVKESVASQKLNLTLGAVLAAQVPGAARTAHSDFAKARRARIAYDHAVHRGEGRLHTIDEGEWPIVLTSPLDDVCFTGIILDLSLAGCTVRTTRPFYGEIDELVEVHFKMQGNSFLLGGKTAAIYDPHTVGILFNPMVSHRRKELAMLLADLCVETRSRLEVA